MAHQRIEAAIESLAHGHEAPLAILAVQLAQHDGFFLRKVLAGKRKAGKFAAGGQQAQITRLHLRHHAAAIDAGRQHHAIYAGGQARQLEGKRGAIALRAAFRFHRAARRARLVEKGHVALVRQLAGRIQAKAGKVERQALGGGADFQHAIGRGLRQRQALALGQSFHYLLLHTI